MWVHLRCLQVNVAQLLADKARHRNIVQSVIILIDVINFI